MGSSAWYATEDARIRTHLLGALDVLRAGDVATLEAPAREARARHIAELERYVAGGRYPRNASREGPRRPALIDPWGTRCALAHLIEKSGERPLLDRLRGLDNHAWVRELAGDRGLLGWLRSAGLTAAEAARIQPSYGPRPTAFQCACQGLWPGGAVGKLTSASTSEEKPQMCRVLVEEVLTPKPLPEAGLVVGSEVDAVCPAPPLKGARVLLIYEKADIPDAMVDYPAKGLHAHALVEDKVVFPAGCPDGGPHNGPKQPSETISLVRVREAMKGDVGACRTTLAGLPYEPHTPLPPRPQLQTPPSPGPSTRPEAGPTPGAEKSIKPLDSTFPQPIHYWGGAGALLVAGTAAYLVARRRS